MNRLPYQRLDENAAYLYRADLYCPTCTIGARITHQDAAPAARDMPVEDVLDQCADAMAIDRHDETSYDSSEFPKVVPRIDLADDDHCGACHNDL
jgi:hypothetical protein